MQDNSLYEEIDETEEEYNCKTGPKKMNPVEYVTK